MGKTMHKSKLGKKFNCISLTRHFYLGDCQIHANASLHIIWDLLVSAQKQTAMEAFSVLED